MNFLTNAWNFLNGKKTNIGAGFLFAGTVLSQVVIGIWHYEPSWIHPLIQTNEWIGLGLTGGGLVHKAIKSK